MNPARRTIRRLREALLGFLYARRLLAARITSERAMAAVRRRIDERPQAFLEMMERNIFAQPPNPYRALLDAAGYSLPRVRELVLRDGVEGTLRRLCDDGVYVAIEEFKGLREARRGARAFRFDPSDFRNPLVRSGLSLSSGGTRSRGIRTMLSAANHCMEAERLVISLVAYGLEARPVAVWLPESHGAASWAVLAFTAVGRVPDRWFAQLPLRFGTYDEPPAYLLGVRTAMRLGGRPLPPITYAPPGEEASVLRWAAGAGAGGAVIFTTPSSALRLALAAQHLGASLAGLTFVTVGEPLTPAKAAAIESVGARARSSLGFTEFGRATYGCASAASPDDMHLCTDGIAAITRRRTVDQAGTEIEALCFTALRSDARRVLLNMETGDYATWTPRRCGCLLETVGWSQHLDTVRSFEKLNPEGRYFLGSRLITLIEEVLPQRFGGTPTDYQLLEREDKEGFTRLDVLVHPRLGDIDADAVWDCVAAELRSYDPLGRNTTPMWELTGVLRVIRDEPMMTGAGKVLALHRLA